MVHSPIPRVHGTMRLGDAFDVAEPHTVGPRRAPMEASAVAISTTPGGAATAAPGSDPELDDSPAPASADGEGYRIFPAPRHSGWKPERPTGLLHAFGAWLMRDPSRDADASLGHGPGHHAQEAASHETHPWWKVMCLTGVDYFSTLGYQPGIAFLAAGALAPVATAILILVTLFGALPMYIKVANDSPHGEGSIQMLRGLLPRWQGKTFILALLGFAATSWIITITLSAADATAHIIENPLAPKVLHHYPVEVTLALIIGLGAVFLKGFKEAIGLAVGLVVVYLALNAAVIGVGLMQIAANPVVLGTWTSGLFATFGDPVAMILAAALLFPNLALGLSGFETGVAVMPQVQGDASDTPARPAGRIRNSYKLLAGSAVIMSLYLMGSSLITTTLIPANEFLPGGKANGRALAYLAYEFLGTGFGVVYDISTVSILWFAGASAMAGLLNLVPNYLPKYGMAPDFVGAIRPLTLILTAIAAAVTIWFDASVDAQGGAYATGVIALMLSGAFAVTLAYLRERRPALAVVFGVITVVFAYTLAVNIIKRPDGLEIATFFIVAILATSVTSRMMRSWELRVDQLVVDDTALKIIHDAASSGTLRIVCNRPEGEDGAGYLAKEAEERAIHNIVPADPVIFLEIYVADSSEFRSELVVTGHIVEQANILRVTATTIPNTIAAIMLWLRDHTGIVPHAYMEWTEGGPFLHAAQFLMFGKGETAPVAREILRTHEEDRARRPFVHVG